MTIQEAAEFLCAHDNYLILTHRRPDGDTIGCAAALCTVLRQMGKTAGVLYNRETTEHFAPYIEELWVADDFDYETGVSVDLAALNLFPDNAEQFKTRVDLAIDHHPSYERFGKHDCVHPECAACGEVIYELADRLGQLTAATRRFYPNWDEARYQDCLRRFALDEGKRVSELSEGMKVKYQLALAMSHHAKLLILDEPTSGLDPAARDDLLGLFLELVERDGASVLFSTHITSDLDACADTITYIRNGEIFASEARRAFTGRYRYLRADEAAVSPELAAKLIAPRRHQGEIEGLLRTADAPEAGSPATLEQIMVHLEREVEA